VSEESELTSAEQVQFDIFLEEQKRHMAGREERRAERTEVLPGISVKNLSEIPEGATLVGAYPTRREAARVGNEMADRAFWIHKSKRQWGVYV